MKSKEQKTAYNKAYYAKNKVHLNARNKAWYLAHPEKAMEASRLSYTRRHSEPWSRAQYLIRAARERAKRKGFACTITAEDIVWQIELGVCAVTGIPFHLSRNNGRHPFTPSIDRVDNAKGYIKGNIRVIVWALNAMRGDWGDEILLQIADALRGST